MSDLSQVETDEEEGAPIVDTSGWYENDYDPPDDFDADPPDEAPGPT